MKNGQPIPLMWYIFILLFNRILALENIDDWTQATKKQVYMSNITKNSNCFSLLRKSGSYKNMLNFMTIVFI